MNMAGPAHHHQCLCLGCMSTHVSWSLHRRPSQETPEGTSAIRVVSLIPEALFLAVVRLAATAGCNSRESRLNLSLSCTTSVAAKAQKRSGKGQTRICYLFVIRSVLCLCDERLRLELSCALSCAAPAEMRLGDWPPVSKVHQL